MRKIFSKQHPAYTYIDASHLEVVINKVGNSKEENELIQDSINLDNSEYSQRVKKVLKRKIIQFKKILKEIQIKNDEPHFPFDEPRHYQNEAYNKWCNNNYKGLFAMATGTGKTITALNCILEEYRINRYYRFLVLVPSLPLVNQWVKEVENKFNFSDVLQCHSKSPVGKMSLGL